MLRITMIAPHRSDEVIVSGDFFHLERCIAAGFHIVSVEGV